MARGVSKLKHPLYADELNFFPFVANIFWGKFLRQKNYNLLSSTEISLTTALVSTERIWQRSNEEIERVEIHIDVSWWKMRRIPSWFAKQNYVPKRLKWLAENGNHENELSILIIPWNRNYVFSSLFWLHFLRGAWFMRRMGSCYFY